MSLSIESAAADIRLALHQATKGLLERNALVEMIILGAVASEHLLTVGPPGTAKSLAVRQVAKSLGGKYFEYLLGRYSEPSELFGTVDLNKLRTGTVETQTQGMLPEAEIVFLDEVFLGSTSILNTLLSVLNERVFRRGHTRMQCPLRICVGATNALPEDESLAAFADRFLLHVFVESIPDPFLEDLLFTGWNQTEDSEVIQNGLEKLDCLSQAAKSVDMNGIRPLLAFCIRKLREVSILLSDRRIVKTQKIIAAASVLAGRTTANGSDLWPLIYAIPSHEGQLLARSVLKDQLDSTENDTLTTAAEEASGSPTSRKRRLMEQSEEALSSKANPLKIQSILRDIDANFSQENLPEELRNYREKLTGLITSKAEGTQ